MSQARFDLHLHTEFSPDCDTSLYAIEAHCLSRGLTGIAVTDHDSIEGALRLRDMVKSLRVIIGEEVSTRDGDVIGLFLKEPIPAKMSALETMQAIHEQGGLVYLPHPFDTFRARRKGRASLSEIVAHVDIVEIFNGKASRESYNTRAAEFAIRHGKIAAGGSDAHHLKAIGSVVNAFSLPDPFPAPAGFLAGLAASHLSGTRHSSLHAWLGRGRRPFSLAWRRLRRQGA